MFKQKRLTIILLAVMLVSFWLLFRPYSVPSATPAIIVARLANNLPDTVLISAGPEYQQSKFVTFFLGQHNRDIWTTPIKVKVLYLDKTFGGLRMAAVGGGMQTLSFTLTDSAGRTYALRSVNKDPISVLPPFWQKTAAGHFVRDQTSGANPYGALIVPVLAQAAGIFQAHPQLRYVRPDDPLFRPYAARAGGRLFLLEEKHQNNPLFYPDLHTASAIINTANLTQNQKRSKTHRIAAEQYLKCRLFDFLIGDWDRHNGQWMWAAYPSGHETWYVPIPKDRDQAFCNYRDGVIPWLVTRKWVMPKFGQFTANLNNVHGLTVNAVHLDTTILANLPVENFIKTARSLQKSLSDNVINLAVRELPTSVHKINGEEISKNLKARRNQLPAAAIQFHQIISGQPN